MEMPRVLQGVRVAPELDCGHGESGKASHDVAPRLGSRSKIGLSQMLETLAEDAGHKVIACVVIR